MKHTPTPWYFTINKNECHVQSSVINEDNYVCNPYGKTMKQVEANAAFICTAVNNHEALKEALKECIDELKRFGRPQFIKAEYALLRAEGKGE